MGNIKILHSWVLHDEESFAVFHDGKFPPGGRSTMLCNTRTFRTGNFRRSEPPPVKPCMRFSRAGITSPNLTQSSRLRRPKPSGRGNCEGLANAGLVGQPASHEHSARSASVPGLDESSPAGCRLGQSPFFEHVQRPPRRPSGYAVPVGELGHRGHLLTGLQLSVLDLLPDLVSYPQVGRLGTAGLAHPIMIKPGKPSHSAT